MARTTLTVDGVILLDDNLGPWIQHPPPELEAILKPRQPQPWSIHVQAELTKAVIIDRPTDITITNHPHGWSMNINHVHP